LKPQQALSLISAYSWTNSLPKELIDLQNDVEATGNLTAFEKELPEIRKQIEMMEWEAVALKSNSNLTYHDLTVFETQLVKIKAQLDKINEPIRAHVQNLEKWYKAWLEKEKQLNILTAQITSDPDLKDMFSAGESLAETIRTAKKLIEGQIKPNLLAGQQIGINQTRVYVLSDTVADLIRDMKKSGSQQTSPPMLSPDFYKNIKSQLFLNGWHNIRLFLTYQGDYLKQNLGMTLLCTFFIVCLALAIFYSRKLTKASATWYPFTAKPLASALFIVGSGFTIVNSLGININLPPDLVTLLYFPVVIAVIFLTDIVCKISWQASLLKQLLIFLGVTLLMAVFSLPQMLSYLIAFYLSMALFCYYMVLFVRRIVSRSQQAITWAILLWAVFPLSVIVAGIAGFDQFAIVIFSRVLSLVGITLIIWLMVQMTAGLFELLLTIVPIRIIQQNAAVIASQITPVIIVVHVLLWLTLFLNILWIYPTLNAAFKAITSLQFSLFSMNITPGSILAFVFIIYSSFLVSQGVSAFLKQEVLPRYRVEPGAQISITRLVHYAILTLGFIFLLSVLGFGLNQITIIGGALGVGIGFGLQAIVTNFVSGLILLFERPIKVGDVIEIDTDMGEVKELGLRATTVQTFDNAEIVIPNSQLITNSVTNWTLAERKIRVKVPVGVAYGSDISTVLKILLDCAEANASVLSTPKPTALFLAFGTSSLDFELRCWIADFNDKLIVLSELNQDIESEFSLAGIEIPFPQTDLHLRSVDRELLSQLSGAKSNA
ncbi:MAG: mechanosensitive ion channel domain-containing protein, partial [Desulfocapsaceae bacterium]|jgi:small-conductance mechanosensitive channel|nr:mechanosensitive ion channel domain-containing protein [Desulfocapsaceae bacterium]